VGLAQVGGERGGVGEKWLEGEYSAKKCVQSLCENAKNDTCYNCSRNWGREDKGQQWRGLTQIWYTWYIVGTFLNVTMYPHPAQQKRENF
jgi:hypothetical protein